MLIKQVHIKISLVKLVALLLGCSFNFIGSQGQGYFCPHNKFRCSTGECISTEALCNAKRDCSSAEDERGSPDGKWSCREQTLSKDFCDPASQFRCRFGGCISRQSLCDGRLDCWGGADESYEVCQNGKPVIKDVGAGGNTFVRPPPPPPRATTTSAPRPQQIFTSRTTVYTTPRTPVSTGNRFGGGCPPIGDDPGRGFHVECENSRYLSVDCAEPPADATAVYTCKKYFTPTSSLVVNARRTCDNGQWSQLNQRFSCEADCGIAASETGAFVAGGSTAKAGKWPWMVAIYERSKSSKFEFICGGSLISARAVITAAHCVVRRDNGQHKSLRNLKIVAGKYYRSYDRKSTGEQESEVAEIYAHPDYNRVTLNSDIAIIKLAQPVQITEVVRPVCLPQSRDYTEPGQLGTLVGWGRGDNKRFQEQLQQAQLPVILSQKCIEAHPQFAHLVHRGTFCAGYRNGTSACDGDSGGPLVFRDRFSPSKYLLHGVVSAGIAASDGRSGCNPLYYTVFTDVGYLTIHRWISRIIDEKFTSSLS